MIERFHLALPIFPTLTYLPLPCDTLSNSLTTLFFLGTTSDFLLHIMAMRVILESGVFGV